MSKDEKEDSKKQEALKKSGEIPKHIAIIMDGNGRWAKSKGYSRYLGHQEGVNSVRDIVEASAQVGVKYLTVYTFSTENWRRPKNEVTLLMKLLIKTLRKETERLHKNGVRLISTGNLKELPEQVYNELQDSMKKTKDNQGLVLNLALNYSGRWEIVNTVKKILNDKIPIKDIDEKLFSSYLETAEIPDPDLLIRTGGDYRISNFLLWQTAYSEIYIEDIYWPDFKRDYLYKAIKEYQRRERRFGMISEQIQDLKSINK
ncbi:MAG TPA: isoprenyl transferase [Ignavibacteria bacterium]|nr:isoprenyl transferase [Ignavibacteria bacterium]